MVIEDIVECEGCGKELFHLLPANDDGSVHPSYMSAWDYKLCSVCSNVQFEEVMDILCVE